MTYWQRYYQENKEKMKKAERERYRRLPQEKRAALIAKKGAAVKARLCKIRETAAGSRRPETCEVCLKSGGKSAIQFDHDHKTGKFRGWLCNRCNLLLGRVNDDPGLLRKLAAYLEQ